MDRSKAALARLLPQGGALTTRQWRKRHRTLVVALAAHLPVLLLLGLALDRPVPHLLLELLAPALALLVARRDRLSPLVRSLATTFGLSACSAVLVHLAGGATEAHFHFFLVVGAVALYEQWSALGLAVGFVLVHHLGLGAVDPRLVFDRPGAAAHWVQLSVLHAVAVTAQSAVALTHWRIHELSLAGERRLTRQLLQREAALQEAVRRAEVNALAADVAHGMNTPVQYASDNARFLGSAVTELVALASQTRVALDALPDDRCDGLQDLRERHRAHHREWDGDDVRQALGDCLVGLDEVARLVLELQDLAQQDASPSRGR